MAQVSVTAASSTTLSGVAGNVVQNLGPGVLYVGGGGTTDVNGVKVDVGHAMAIGSGVSAIVLYAASGNCDVRYFNSTGVFAVTGA